MQWILLTALVSTIFLIEDADASYLRLFRMKRWSGDNGDGQFPILPKYPPHTFVCRIENKEEIIRALNDLLFCLGYKIVSLDADCVGATTEPPVVTPQPPIETTTYCPPGSKTGEPGPATWGPPRTEKPWNHWSPFTDAPEPNTWAPPATDGPVTWGPPLTEGPWNNWSPFTDEVIPPTDEV